MKEDNLKYKTGIRRLGAVIVDTLVFVPLEFADNFVQANLGNKIGLVFWLTFMTALTIFYFVFMHYNYGQTFGKMVANVKVVNLDLTRNLTIRQALLRNSFYIAVETIGLLYFVVELISGDLSTRELLDGFDEFGGTVVLIWVLLELLSMLINDKRRAIHDFIAGSVVIKTDIVYKTLR